MRKPIALCLLLALVPPALAEAPIAARLPEDLRALLREEMRVVREATLALLEALVAGDHAEVARQAQGIQESFILKRQLTPAHSQALAALPNPFLTLDARFHATAGRLAAAARAHEVQQQRILFAELVGGCQECHARFAADRYPLFAANPNREEERPAAPNTGNHGHRH